MASSPLKRPKKLVACCDGTWMDSDKGYDKGGLFGKGRLQTPSNVTRIGRAILAEDKNQHPQIVYYQSGVGGGSTSIERFIGGGTGEGIDEHIREAYNFLANNYTTGDQIFLLGFSRGAFTARSIGGLIGGIGLLEKAGLPWFYLIFKDWENAGVKGYNPKILHVIPDFELSSSPENIEQYLKGYRAELKKRGLTREVEVQAIGVWDTVGALGIPTPNFIQRFGLPDFLSEYKFFDTSLDNHIKFAFHALALDEQRSPFGPTVWERKVGCNTVLKQTWFPGVHSNVGGSYDDTELADITLAWMMDNLSAWIDFNPKYVKEQYLANQKRNTARGIERGWGLGRIYESCTFPTSIMGREPRTPTFYHRFDYFTHRETNEPLLDTNETIHPSVRVRIRRGGKGYEDNGKYKPGALNHWKIEEQESHEGHPETNGSHDHNKKQPVKWMYQGKNPKGKDKFLLEEVLGRYELELLRLDEAAATEVLGAN